MKSKVVTTIRDAIKTSGETRYAIAKRAGVSQSQLSRLIHGKRGMLRLDTIERLADALGLRITIEPKGKTRKGR